jgi:hypothetical protein
MAGRGHVISAVGFVGVDYMYLWVAGIHLKVRLDQEKLCLRVTIVVRGDGWQRVGRRPPTAAANPPNRGLICCAAAGGVVSPLRLDL